MSAEIVVEGHDYQFSTDAWARYTGRQIIAASLLLLAVSLLVAGFVLKQQSFATAVVETSEGVLLVEGGAGPVFGAGIIATTIAAVIGGVRFPLWPWPSDYGEPIEEGST